MDLAARMRSGEAQLNRDSAAAYVRHTKKR
jgi:hypothetical protein